MFDPDARGVDFSFRGSAGISVMTQFEWDRDGNGRPGRRGVGMNNVWFDGPDFNAASTTDGFIHYYLQLDQQITAESQGQGMYPFGTLAHTHQEEAALVPFHTGFGAQYVVLFEGRDQ